MKHITKLIFVLCFTLCMQSTFAQQAQRMYFVGNSLTDNIKYGKFYYYWFATYSGCTT